MSGHSKWATIKHKKGATDAKRGRVFTRIIREISIAARIGGGDPTSNPRLRTAILAAKGANMPNDNVERAVLRGTGQLEGEVYEEATFEGYGPGGVGMLIQVVTTNRNRVVGEFRHLMSRNGGNMAEAGAVGWMFSRKGEISVAKEAEIAMVPQNYIKLTGAQATQMVRLVEAFEEHDDVQHVYANFDIDEAEIQAAVAG